MPSIKKKSSHKHKKFNRYTANPSARRGRKKTPLAFWLVPAFALAAFAIAILLGSFLGEQVPPATEAPQTTEPAPKPTLPPPENIIGGETVEAVFVTLRGITGNTAAEVSAQIPNGATAVSLSLFDENGTPYFSSEIALTLGKPCGELTLKNTFKPILENRLYSSVLFPSSALTGRNSTDRYMQNAYELSLIRELVEAGADEILIYCTSFGNSISSILSEEDFPDRFIEYTGDVKRKFPDLKLGFALSITDASNPDLAESIRTIAQYVDFLAADATSFSSADELSDAINVSAVSIMRYEMRILLGGISKTDFEEQCALLDKLGIKNRQTVLQLGK